MTRFLTTEEAAELLQIRVQTVLEWLRLGRIPGKKVGKAWRIREDELLEAMSGRASTQEAM